MMIFENGGSPRFFITSVDWMERNLDKRIEVGGEVKSPQLKLELDRIFKTLWKGNVKARVLDGEMRNRYFRNNLPIFNAQTELHNFYAQVIKTKG